VSTEPGQPQGKAFSKAADRAKLNPDSERKLRFHDLRRTVASALLTGDFDLAYVAHQLGHSPDVLLKTYAGIINARKGAKKGLAAIQAARAESLNTKT